MDQPCARAPGPCAIDRACRRALDASGAATRTPAGPREARTGSRVGQAARRRARGSATSRHAALPRWARSETSRAPWSLDLGYVNVPLADFRSTGRPAPTEAARPTRRRPVRSQGFAGLRTDETGAEATWLGSSTARRWWSPAPAAASAGRARWRARPRARKVVVADIGVGLAGEDPTSEVAEAVVEGDRGGGRRSRGRGRGREHDGRRRAHRGHRGRALRAHRRRGGGGRHPARADAVQHGRGRVGRGDRHPPQGPLHGVPPRGGGHAQAGERLARSGSPPVRIAGSVAQANYSAAKGGIVSLVRSAAAGLYRYGVRANAIAPIARTRMSANVPMELAEMGDPEDVAPMVVYLLSDAAKHVTGQVYTVVGSKIAVWNQPVEVRAMWIEGRWTPEQIAERGSTRWARSAWGSSTGSSRSARQPRRATSPTPERGPTRRAVQLRRVDDRPGVLRAAGPGGRGRRLRHVRRARQHLLPAGVGHAPTRSTPTGRGSSSRTSPSSSPSASSPPWGR